jgi:hypothetical protein
LLSQKYEGLTGKYFDRDREIEPSEESFDAIKRNDLWNTSIDLTQIENEL